ncbi:hypothetical protein [Methylocapsa sp. S129]|uniref:hypothetical protein n=1 Tax=Methylocapsa sp. S129 TaxID=1641869 RepID=UPI00131C2B46|nr:hypothetical protein [Methylocapsa sp. S129]
MSRRHLAAAGIAIVSFGSLSTPSHAQSYQDWLLSRQSGNGAALYNQPCTVSDGQRETVVPCQIVAAALDGYSIPIAYYGGEAISAPHAYVYAYPRRRRHCRY